MTSRPVPLVVLRHGPTDWNAARRIQGRSDRPLSAAGRVAVRRWRLPDACVGYDWTTSPLLRARETAALMGHGDARVEPALIETDWGRWEGRTLAELRERHGAEMAEMEARGLDFRPPGGESPRDVQARLAPWLRRVAAAGRPCVAVCHKGVIRALAALASDWDMTGPPPEKLRDESAHRLLVGPDGTAILGQLNLPLVP
jgi:probable phosphoglycerate mutase